MRTVRLFIFLAAAYPWAAAAWDTRPHQIITKAALDALPAPVVHAFGTEAGPLIEIYCTYPDRFLEMERYGFVRKGAGPQSASEIRDYCMRPNGTLIHGPTGNKAEDLASLVFLFERISASLAARKPEEAAKYAGVLSHFIADSQSPSHAVSAQRLAGMKPWYSFCDGTKIHSIIERSIPEFSLGSTPPRVLGASLRAAAEAVLESCYTGVEANRKDLPAMAKAACAGDEVKLNSFRERAGRRAAVILADALYTVAGAGTAER